VLKKNPKQIVKKRILVCKFFAFASSLIIFEKLSRSSKKYIKNINRKTKFKSILKKEKIRNKNNKINILINKKLKLEFSKVLDIFGVVNLFIGK
jgi:hypothetical protein